MVENPPVNAGDAGSISGLGRPSGEGNGNTFQYPGLENSMDRADCWVAVCGVAESDTPEVTEAPAAQHSSKPGDGVRTDSYAQTRGRCENRFIRANQGTV